jgi:protein phosphatase
MLEDDPEGGSRRRTLSQPVAGLPFQSAAACVSAEFGASSRTAPGHAVNEDQFLVLGLGRQQVTLATSLGTADLPPTFDERGYGILVADGMGRDGAGALASRLALAAVARLSVAYGRWDLRVDEHSGVVMSERLEWLYQQVEDVLRFYGRSDPLLAAMGSTLTAAFSAGTDLFLAHVGHSRAYLYRDGELMQLTRDQTVEQTLQDHRRPAPVNLVVQDLSHLLTDALGSAGGGRTVDVERVRLRDDDCLVLATDGLTTVLDDAAIADVLANRRTLEEQCRALVDLAFHRGSADDTTVVMARYTVPPAARSL